MAGRWSQDVPLVVVLPTSANIRWDADAELVATRPTTAKIRWSQDVVLVALGHIRTKVWVVE
jgi:hypothetical protein